MGSGNSGLYTGTYGATTFSSISENAYKMKDDYELSNNGYFGYKGKNSRVMPSSNPIESSINFFARIGKGGIIKDLPNGKGKKTVLSDGTTIVHRIITSTKGSPAVEITVSGSTKIKNQKIHFIQEK